MVVTEAGGFDPQDGRTRIAPELAPQLLLEQLLLVTHKIFTKRRDRIESSASTLRLFLREQPSQESTTMKMAGQIAALAIDKSRFDSLLFVS